MKKGIIITSIILTLTVGAVWYYKSQDNSDEKKPEEKKPEEKKSDAKGLSQADADKLAEQATKYEQTIYKSRSVRYANVPGKKNPLQLAKDGIAAIKNELLSAGYSLVPRPHGNHTGYSAKRIEGAVSTTTTTWKVKQDQRLGEKAGNIQVTVKAGQIVRGKIERYFAMNKHLSGVPYDGLHIPLENLTSVN